MCGKYSVSLYSTLNSFPVFHLLKTLLTITDPLNSQPKWRSGPGANIQSCSSLWCLFRLQWVTTSWYHYNYDSHKTQGNDRFIWFLTACRLLIKDTHKLTASSINILWLNCSVFTFWSFSLNYHCCSYSISSLNFAWFSGK